MDVAKCFRHAPLSKIQIENIVISDLANSFQSDDLPDNSNLEFEVIEDLQTE